MFYFLFFLEAILVDSLAASAEVAAIISASDSLRRELEEIANVHRQRRVGGHVAHL